MMPRTVECNLSLSGDRRGKSPTKSLGADRVPRIARLLALAIRMEGLIRNGGIGDYSALAQLGHVSRARITQIMNLLLLAPGIQEQILFLAPLGRGHEPIHLAQLQPIAREPDWKQQRVLWDALTTIEL